MKLVLKYLLQTPLFYFLLTGLDSITGGNLWITTLGSLGVLFLYITGDYLDIEK